MSETRHGVDVDKDFDGVEYRERAEELSWHTRLRDERMEWSGDDWPDPRPGERPTKVALIGKANSRVMAPWGEEGWEFWGLNEAPPSNWHGCPPVRAHTRWFQLHPPRYLEKHHPAGLEDLALNWSEPSSVRLYMDRHYDEYPASEKFDRRLLQRSLYPSFHHYHATSFDWMLALAIHEHFEEIHCFGIDFRTFPIMDGESISARPCFEYWVGVAHGRDIHLEVTTGGHLFHILHLACMQSSLEYGWHREPGHDLEGDLALITGDHWRDMR